MKKEKKITVAHFLNKRVRAKAEEHPLYVRCRYDRIKTELKSQFQLFMDQVDSPYLSHEIGMINDFEDVGINIFNSFTEDSFENPSSKIKQAIEDEKKTIHDIIKLYAQKDINIIALNSTAEIIQDNLFSIHDILSIHYKVKLREATEDYYNGLFPFSADETEFPNIYDFFEKIAHKHFKQEVLEKFKPAILLFKYLNEFSSLKPIKYYQWEFEKLEAKFIIFLTEKKVKKPQIEELIKMINQAFDAWIKLHRPLLP